MLTSPTEPKEALARLAAQALLPTGMSSEELMNLAVDLRERSFFSARTMNSSYLQQVKDKIESIVNPKQVMRAGRMIPVTEGLNLASARLELKQALDAINYVPAKRGTITDLRSDQRLNLVLRMNSEQAQGYANWRQTQDETLLDAFPAQELFRAESRDEPRDWITRWQQAGGKFYGGGRMIAVKNASIWTKISRFGLPYPPFDFNSGMDVMDVDRLEAVELGVISAGHKVQPERRPFETEEVA